jgi:hypothetical protein
MTHAKPDMPDAPPRRGFFSRLAGATALGLAGLAAQTSRAQPADTGSDAADWPGTLKGRHRQVVDAYAVNGGFPLIFAHTFVAPNPPGSATAVVILRHAAFPIALNDTMWQKYRIGQSCRIDDPETRAPAVKNPFLNPKPGVLMTDDMAVDRLLANGTLFGACNLALLAMSGMLAANAGVDAATAAREWTANLIPGITLIASGTWGVNRAQEAGCSYCAGG